MVIIYKPAFKKKTFSQREKKKKQIRRHFIILLTARDRTEALFLRVLPPLVSSVTACRYEAVCDSDTLSTWGNNPDSAVSFEKRLVKKSRLSDFCLPVLLAVVNTVYLQKKKNPIKRFFFLALPQTRGSLTGINGGCRYR